MPKGISPRRGLWLLAAFLAACATPSAQPESSYRVVRRTNVPLVERGIASHGFSQHFEQWDIEGSVNDTGSWTIQTVVKHSHLRCGVYEAGIQLGRGKPGCAQPTWFGEPQYGTREWQCNSASMIHAGGGILALSPEEIAAASCVSVLVRCSGVCG